MQNLVFEVDEKKCRVGGMRATSVKGKTNTLFLRLVIDFASIGNEMIRRI